MTRKMNRALAKKISEDIVDWLLINLIVPFLLPLFFAYFFCKFNADMQNNIKDILILLSKDGVYTFWGLTVLVSLFQDYRTVRSAYGIFFWAFFFGALIIMSFIFASSLGYITGNIAISFEKNFTDFIIITSTAMGFSIVFKVFITIKKYSH
jgi:hypothetical protein